MDAHDETVPGNLLTNSDALRDNPDDAVDVDVAREATRMKLFGARQSERKVSRFTLLERVGSGGMGTVYVAHDPQLDRKVAVKLLGGSSSGTNADDDARRMVTEARAMARVAHPNVITVFEVGKHDEPGEDPLVFVAMELVRGRTLRRWVEDENPSPARIVAAYADAGRGLAAVHAAGLVHRDFKPDNVMISDEDGRVQVMDFGLARGGAIVDHDATETGADLAASSFASELTRTGSIAGTPAYMAPEQLSGSDVDHRADQFSFCVSLFEALFSRRPFPGSTPNEVAAAVLLADEPPEPPRGVVSARVRAAIRRGLSPDPVDRWPTMAALVERLAPRNRRRAAWVGVAVGVAGIGWGVYGSVAEPAPCRDAEAEFGNAWDDDARQRVAAAYGSVDAEYARRALQDTERKLDEYRGQWIAEHRVACEATHVAGSQSTERLDLRMRCLGRRRAQVVGLVDVLSSADDETIQNTNAMLDRLVDPEQCDDDAYLGSAEPPSTADGRAEAAAIRSELERGDMMFVSGRAAQALVIVRDALTRAEQLDYAPLLAEALVVAGDLEVKAGDVAQGAELLERGYAAARRGGLPVTAAEAAIYRAGVTKPAEQGKTGTDTWLQIAKTEVDTHDLDRLRPVVLLAEATFAERKADWRAAIDIYLRLIEILQETCTSCEALAVSYHAIGSAYSQLGEHEEALRYTARALEVADEAYASDHPQRAAVLVRRGQALVNLRRFEEALPFLQEAYEIRDRVMSPDNPNLSSTASALGLVYVALGRTEEGIALIERALVIARAYGDAYFVAGTLHQLAQARERNDENFAAESAWGEAVELMEREFPQGHPATAVFLAGIATSKAQRGDHEAAVPGLERALALHRQFSGGDSPETAGLLGLLAESLMAVGRGEEALEHLRQAVALTEKGPLAHVGVRARRLLAQALSDANPAEAREVLTRITARCEALDEVSREAARCRELSLVKLDESP